VGSVANQSAASRFILKLDRNTEVAQAVYVMIARAKIIKIFMIEVNKLIFFRVRQRGFRVIKKDFETKKLL